METLKLSDIRKELPNREFEKIVDSIVGLSGFEATM